MISFSAALKEAMYAQDAKDVTLILLLTLDHEDWADPIRVAYNNSVITSRGHDFLPVKFDVTFEPHNASSIGGTTQLSVDNIGLEFIQAIRETEGDIIATIEAVCNKSLDTVELTMGPLNLRNVTYDKHIVAGDLISDEALNDNIPKFRFSPNLTPAVF